MKTVESDKLIAELERKNAELDCQMNRNKHCYSCVNATDRCFRNEIGCPCGNYKSHKDEITELKGKLLNLKITQIKDLERKIASQRGTIRVYNNKLKSRLEQVERLKQENKELREENKFLKEQCLILADGNVCSSTCSEIKKQLTKAKEILTKLLEEEKNNTYWEMNGSDKSSYYEVRKQAEQFLKE